MIREYIHGGVFSYGGQELYFQSYADNKKTVYIWKNKHWELCSEETNVDYFEPVLLQVSMFFNMDSTLPEGIILTNPGKYFLIYNTHIGKLSSIYHAGEFSLIDIQWLDFKRGCWIDRYLSLVYTEILFPPKRYPVLRWDFEYFTDDEQQRIVEAELRS